MAKYAYLVGAILVGLTIGHMFGPLNSLPRFFSVDERYLQIVRNHALLLGFAASLAACTVNLVLKVPPVKLLGTLAVVAALWFTASRAADPGFLTHLAGALPGFLVAVLVAAAPVVGVFWLLERRLR